MAQLTEFPKISIVTPSYNHAPFLEATIRSILDQHYPNLEYIIMDGGSTDGSVEIIKRYQDRLAYWQSEKDRGQNHAITEGFKHATGDIFAYLNSDDVYLPWTFRTVAQLLTLFPKINWLTSRSLMIMNAAGRPGTTYPATNYARTWFYRGMTLGLHGNKSGWIQQEATFWRKSLWDQAGGYVDEKLYLVGDFELWARFWQYANLVTTAIPLAGFRMHTTNKTADADAEYKSACWQILNQYTKRTLRNEKKRWAAEQVLRWTGRGGKRWGSTVNWLNYEQRTQVWSLHSRFVI